MLGDDEKRAMDALMDAMDSDDEDDSEDEAQAKSERHFNSPDYDRAGAKDDDDCKAGSRSNIGSGAKEPMLSDSPSDFVVRDRKAPHVEKLDDLSNAIRRSYAGAKDISSTMNGADMKSTLNDDDDVDDAFHIMPARSLTPTRAPPKPARASKPNMSSKAASDNNDGDSPRIIELPDDNNGDTKDNAGNAIQGVRSPEFRGRYTTGFNNDFDSDDDDIDAGKKFVLRRSSENLQNLQRSPARSGGSTSISNRGIVGRPTGPSTSDKVRMSDIDSFGMSSSVELGQHGGAVVQNSTDFTTIDSNNNFNKPIDGISAQAAATSESIESTKKWLTSPYPRNSRTLLCYVEREREGFSSMHPTFRMYNEQNIHTGQGARFMMAAKKVFGKSTSYYLVSLDHVPDDRGSESVLGRVKSNTVGSEYCFTDGGVAASKTRLQSTIRKELGYAKFSFDSKGPSRIEGWVPHVTQGGKVTVWQPEDDDSGIEAHIKVNDISKLIYLENKQPKWDAAHGGHVLNFHGRVTESSVKNFQLCCPDLKEDIDDEEVVLQFGKVGKDKFTLDLQWPLSPLQAFCICVASLDGKIADRKGYEFIKKTSNFLFGSKDK